MRAAAPRSTPSRNGLHVIAGRDAPPEPHVRPKRRYVAFIGKDKVGDLAVAIAHPGCVYVVKHFIITGASIEAVALGDARDDEDAALAAIAGALRRAAI